MQPLLLLSMLLLPVSARALSIAGPGCNNLLSNSRCFANGIGNLLMFGTGALVGIAIIFYFAGIALRLWDASEGNEKQYEALQSLLKWGFLGIFVILTIGGILSVMGNLFFGTNNFNSLW